MPDLFISPEAELDLDEIWVYITQDSQSAERADRFLDRFAAVFRILAENPYLGRRRDDLRPAYRSFPMGDFVIIYRVTESDDVRVLRIVHGRRDIQALFEG